MVAATVATPRAAGLPKRSVQAGLQGAYGDEPGVASGLAAQALVQAAGAVSAARCGVGLLLRLPGAAAVGGRVGADAGVYVGTVEGRPGDHTEPAAQAPVGAAVAPALRALATAPRE